MERILEKPAKATVLMSVVAMIAVYLIYIMFVPFTFRFVEDGEDVLVQEDVRIFTNLEKNADESYGSERVYGEESVRFKFEHKDGMAEFKRSSWKLRFKMINTATVNLLSFDWDKENFVIVFSAVELE